MDPSRLLGVEAGAGADAVRAAHRRLARLVDPTAGGSAELGRLVDAARDVLLHGGDPAALTVDPHRVLDVPAAASTGEVRAAFRRIAGRVHPDRGGTHELFLVVATAHQLLDPRAPQPDRGRQDAAGRRRRPPPRPSPPPPPPPPGPWRPPPDGRRYHPSRWRTAGSLLVSTTILLAATAVWAALAWLLAREAGLFAAPLAAVLLATGATVARPVVHEAARALVLLRGSLARVAPDADPTAFLKAACLGGAVVREDEDRLYAAYVEWCAVRGTRPVPAWAFVEHLRSLGLLYVKASSWESGVWVGVELRGRRTRRGAGGT